MNRNKHLTLPVLALAGALALTACGGGSDDVASAGSSSAQHGGSHSGGGGDDAARAEGNAADISYLTGMTPHHEQAVEMSEIVLSKNPPAEVAEIARRIKDAQAPEIRQMEEMLAALGHDGDGGGHGSGHGSAHGDAHSSAHGGMMSDADMAAFRSSTGTDAARTFLTAMIAHHRGAIEASDEQIADGQYPPAIELAEQIKQAQAAEITEMERILATL